MTADYTNHSLIKTQYGIFFSNPISRPDLLTQIIADEYSVQFDASPIILPTPAEIPEFPVAQIKSANNQWQVVITRLRADIVYSPEPVKKYADIDTELQLVKEIVLKLANEARSQKVSVSRVTNISNLFWPSDSPQSDLQDLLFKKTNKDFSEVVVKYNRPITDGDLSFNNIFQFETGKIESIKDGSETSGILLLRDFNTDPKSKSIFDNKDIELFFEKAAVHSHSVAFE